MLHPLEIVATLVAAYLVKVFLTRKKLPAPLPPGPKQKPLIGNLLDLPPSGGQDWVHWYKFKELYGPISSIRVLGETFIIINEAQIAVDLLEKRSAIHSSRPQGQFNQMTGYGEVTSAMAYTDTLRVHRKLMYKQIGSVNSVSRFDKSQEAEVGRFMLRSLEAPQDLLAHLRKLAGGVILKVAYGYNIERDGEDPLVEIANDGVEKFAQSITPGAWLVDFIPALKYIPAWFPGGGFQKDVEEFRVAADKLSAKPYAFVLSQMSRNAHAPSFLSGLFEKEGIPKPGSEQEATLKWAAATLYGGGSDTTVSTLGSFYLALVLFPEVQKKAQEEIDRVVGTSRLPGFADRENLPYVEAVVKEAFRWHPVVPMGVVHKSTEEDTWGGYYIPKGSQILPNIWAFLHDPKTYPDPSSFKPERFLASENHTPERDPHLLAFGFGRRVCPGRTVADATAYLTIAQSLAVFNFGKPIKDGKEVDLKPDFLPGMISHPAPYEISIKPRSEQHEALVRAVEENFPWEESHAKELDQ
ncbi:cytochrome P450 monooxygenase fmaG [Aspergillus homomorphus CBS 101889]|uniref:O-methylsterigmatocystin oxidoreductase n=1 Tax=Aspergillus homomorphus (strain CBS 101889) TaxID=1450537 RepID=A0A395HZX5_ASPHC|nr:O-methylsterigmatocystin oxidoreductase [Aspergillus homomorphus CBS 101889]RAL12933.1 O-methylsterigmatocystin oxidoreductase [Aspergillus homomorphus CBS 101889]